MMDCAICFERINVDQKLLRCGHQFHGGCVEQWFCRQKRGSCPLCRTPITPRQRNDSSLGQSMELDDSDEEEEYVDHYEEDRYEEDRYEENRYEEDDTYEAISEEEVEYSDMTTDDTTTDDSSTVEISRITTASDTVDETMELESISSTESFSSNESEQGNDSDDTDGEERDADAQSS